MNNDNLINEILHLFKDSDLEEFKLNDGNTFVEIKRRQSGEIVQKVDINTSNNSASELQSTDDVEANKIESTVSDEKFIISPTVGIFYSRPKPDKEDYVKVGDHVKKGDVVGLVEAMKTFSEIKSPIEGTIQRVLTTNNKMIEFSEKLFSVK